MQSQSQQAFPIPRYVRHRAKKAAKRIEKRTGIALNYLIILLLGHIHRGSKKLNRGLTEEEIGVPYASLNAMVNARLLDKERGFQTMMDNGVAVSESEPVSLFKLTSRLAAFSLIWNRV